MKRKQFFNNYYLTPCFFPEALPSRLLSFFGGVEDWYSIHDTNELQELTASMTGIVPFFETPPAHYCTIVFTDPFGISEGGKVLKLYDDHSF